MYGQTMWVPFSTLSDTTHSVQARLIWLLLGLQSDGNPSALTTLRLHQLSGLDFRTIAAARAKLAQSPLAPCHARSQPSCAAIPTELLINTALSAGARLLYGQLQGVSDFADQSGSFTFAALSRICGRTALAVRRAVAELAGAGWLTFTQAHRKSPLCFTLQNPVSAQLRARVSRLRRKVKSAQHRGEAILRELLTLLLALDEYEDDAAPDFLVNPYTGEFMELDRYYPEVGFAVEFNGDQHSETTSLATFEQTVKQVGRDAMKAYICKARGIELAVIHPEELGLKGIAEKLPVRLPRRKLEGTEPLLAVLEELASEYRERTAAERAHRSPGRSGGRSNTN